MRFDFYNIACAATETEPFCRYMNGAATNPDCHVLAFAGAQVKKGLDVAKKLGAENFGKAPTHVKNVSMFLSCVCVCASLQCSGEEEKVSTPSTTPTLAPS